MKQFKPAIAGLAILVVVVLGWTGWHCTRERAAAVNLSLAAATTVPAAPPISVKDKMLHPYWGNCSKCHVTADAGKPVSKVMAGAPISIKDKMPHKYWGNCLQCHKVIDGLQPKKSPRRAKAAALRRLTSRSLGLKVQTVTGAMMRQFGLAKEDGVLVLEVAPDSIAAGAGLQKGDEIVRAGKVRVETAQVFEATLNKIKPGNGVKINIYRGKKSRNLMLKIPESFGAHLNAAAATTPMTQNRVETLAEQFGVPKTQQDVARALQRQQQGRVAAATAPMTQNRVETLAEQFGVPKTQQDVARALQRQQQGRVAANLNYGKVAVASMGPGLGYQVSHQFGASPYFVVFDTRQNSYRVVANPNANDATGRGIQTGQYMVDLGVSNVVAGSFNQGALRTLHNLRVNVYPGVSGSVQDVLSSYVAGDLVPNNTAQNLRVARPGRNPSPGGGVRNVQPVY
jgi:predicted Fe-Mo cluster-binding NifX family protein